ncbi:flagellar hook protein FlgE [Palleronia marisminoris]|uniref:Flagellar hook protein FlgE n=1 Tax=Palleronia marisminoris TaxID=315423 RepID=A0A1Y5SX14_9RHOB|nr:flagellar hook-basal body complex protein [Palleronia marisminoris]SFH04820.1 flagellar hook protein FlgE [Palleronia marisminoris]SLN50463.1 Flagellar hook protein FlgE [Palleronia marisminoris]
MSISASLASGISGLSANSTRLASISDNIANSATYGYKRSVTEFHSLVVSGGGQQSTGSGVRTTGQRLVDEQGQLQNSSNSTDISINGRGFLPVTDLEGYNPGGATKLALMTTGSFRPDAEGNLVNATGKVLLGVPANLDGSFPNFPRDSVDGLEPVNIFHNQFAANPTTEMTLALNLPSDDSVSDPLGGPHDLTVEYFGNLGQAESLSFGFEPTGDANEWTMTVTDSQSGDTVGEFTILFNATNDGGGQIETVTPFGASGGTYDDADGNITLPIGGGTMAVNIGGPNQSTGITQLDSSFAPSNIIKNGAATGNLTGVEVAQDGIVHAIYDTGMTRPIFQVPVIDVPNRNGLKASDSQTYEVSLESGGIFLWDAGTGPVGATMGYSREGSTTDVATELTNLIQTQRAYSSNAKVIQTVDEMLQETTNLKR